MFLHPAIQLAPLLHASRRDPKCLFSFSFLHPAIQLAPLLHASRRDPKCPLFLFLHPAIHLAPLLHASRRDLLNARFSSCILPRTAACLAPLLHASGSGRGKPLSACPRVRAGSCTGHQELLGQA